MNPSGFHFSDFLAYVQHPYYIHTEQPDGTWRTRLRLFWQLWCAKAKIGFALVMVAAGLQLLVTHYTGLAFDHSFGLKGWGFVLSLVVLAPLLEETLFRGMFKPNAGHLALIACALTFYAITHTLEDWSTDRTTGMPMLMILALLAGVPLLVYRGCRAPQRLARLTRFWRAHFGLIYYIVAIGFGLVHLSNFHHLTVWHYLLAPVLTLPQLFSGFYLGYVRMKYGIWYGITLHALWNALPASLTVAYLLMHR